MTDFPLRQSAIAKYLECPRKAQYECVEGHWRRPTAKMGIGTLSDKVITRVVAHLKAHGALPPHDERREWAREEAPAVLNEVDDDASEKGGAFVDRAFALSEGWIEHVLPLLGEIEGCQVSFEVHIDGERVTGTADILTPTSLRDTKTTWRSPIPWGSPSHRFQLGLYSLAFPNRTGAIDYLIAKESTPRQTKANPFPKLQRTVKHHLVVLPPDEMWEEARVARATVAHVAEQTSIGDYPRNPTACESFGAPCPHLARCMPWRASAVEAAAAAARIAVADEGAGT